MEQLKLEEKYSWIDEEIKKLKERKEKYPPDSYMSGVIDGSIATLESIKESNELTSSPTISDEEIKKWAKEYTCKEYDRLIFDYENYDTYEDFVNGAKKYREQLKLK